MALISWLLSLIYLLFNYKKIVFSKNYIKLLTLMVLVISLLPPLPAFAIYFCFIHSTHHIKRIIPTLLSFMEKKKILYLMIIFSVLSWLGGLGFSLSYFIKFKLIYRHNYKSNFYWSSSINFSTYDFSRWCI